jgi:cell division protein FtsB
MNKDLPKYYKFYRILFAAIILFVLSWVLIWSNYSLWNKMKLSHRKHNTVTELNRLKAEGDSLARANNQLKTDPAIAEEVAREDHGFIQKGETVYRFGQTPQDSLQTGDKKKQKKH